MHLTGVCWYLLLPFESDGISLGYKGIPLFGSVSSTGPAFETWSSGDLRHQHFQRRLTGNKLITKGAP